MAKAIHIQFPHQNAKVRYGTLVASGWAEDAICSVSGTLKPTSGGTAITGTTFARSNPRSKDTPPRHRWMIVFKGIPDPGTSDQNYTLTVTGEDVTHAGLTKDEKTFTVRHQTNTGSHPHPTPLVVPPFYIYPSSGDISAVDFTPYGDLTEPLVSVVLYEELTTLPVTLGSPIYPLFVFADPIDLQFWDAQFDVLTPGTLYQLNVQIGSTLYQVSGLTAV